MVGALIVLAFWGGLYPNTFLKPMEKSIGAVRHMALNPAGQRPSWVDYGQEIDDDGSLVEVYSRTDPGSLEIYSVASTIAPANMHFVLKAEAQEVSHDEEEAH